MSQKGTVEDVLKLFEKEEVGWLKIQDPVQRMLAERAITYTAATVRLLVKEVRRLRRAQKRKQKQKKRGSKRKTA